MPSHAEVHTASGRVAAVTHDADVFASRDAVMPASVCALSRRVRCRRCFVMRRWTCITEREG